MSDVVVLGVAGIVVSGVLGPAVASVLSRQADTRRFQRDQIAHHRDQLRDLVDDAAVLLASGPTNLRLLREAPANSPDRANATEWLRDVFPIGQRLQLWLPSDHAAVVAYERVREALVAAVDAVDPEQAMATFEDLRRRFLDEARGVLLAPIAAQGGPL